jgi:hypothetical protein
MNRLIFIFLLLLFFSCVHHDLPVNCSGTDLTLQVDTVLAASRCDSGDGEILVHAYGGIEPYLFSLDGNTWTKNSDFSDLRSALHTIFVKDLYGCETSLENIVVGVKHFDAQISTTPDNDCLNGSGTLEINVLENNGPYLFQLGSGAFTSDNAFQNLQEGDHLLSVKDADGCIVVRSVTIQHGSTGVSWQNDILPIIEASCAVSGCHDGITYEDWRDYDNVKQYAAVIREKTQNRSMPFDRTLPQEQIDKIACWVDDGALNN